MSVEAREEGGRKKKTKKDKKRSRKTRDPGTRASDTRKCPQGIQRGGGEGEDGRYKGALVLLTILAVGLDLLAQISHLLACVLNLCREIHGRPSDCSRSLKKANFPKMLYESGKNFDEDEFI